MINIIPASRILIIFREIKIINYENIPTIYKRQYQNFKYIEMMKYALLISIIVVVTSCGMSNEEQMFYDYMNEQTIEGANMSAKDLDFKILSLILLVSMVNFSLFDLHQYFYFHYISLLAFLLVLLYLFIKQEIITTDQGDVGLPLIQFFMKTLRSLSLITLSTSIDAKVCDAWFIRILLSESSACMY